MMDVERPSFFKNIQDSFRADYNLRSAMSRVDTEGASIGSRVDVPILFTKRHSYMRVLRCNIYRWYDYPNFIITFTWNPKWGEGFKVRR